jgi:hypothetical protein
MTLKKPEPNRMKTSLADLLAQKNIPLPLIPDDDERFRHLEQENRMLKDQLALLRAESGRLREKTGSWTTEPVIDTEELFRRAVAELKSENPIIALGLLQAIVILCPGHIRAMLNLAVVYAEMDQEFRAMETLRAVLVLDPDNATARWNMNILKEQANS